MREGTPKKKNARRCQLDYETSFWVIFLVSSAIVIQDRWTLNPWPMQVDNPPFEGPGSVVFFDVMARFSGRLTIMTNNVMFYTMMHCWANFFAEHAPKWVYVGDIREVHRRIHYRTGWLLLGIPMILHVWSIIIPRFFGVTLSVMEKRPFGLPFYHEGNVNLAHDDVYRLILMSCIWFVILPVSLLDRVRRKSWTFANYLHLFGGLYFAVDLIRKQSHPHSHVFNTPFVIFWAIDRIYSAWKYRKTNAKLVKIMRLDDDYALLFFRTNHKYPRKIGDVYRINMPKSSYSKYHMPNPFTMWSNYRNVKTPDDSKLLNPGFAGHKFSVRNLNDVVDVNLAGVKVYQQKPFPALGNIRDVDFEDVAIEFAEVGIAGSVSSEKQSTERESGLAVPDPVEADKEFTRLDSDISLGIGERAFSFMSDGSYVDKSKAAQRGSNYKKMKKVEAVVPVVDGGTGGNNEEEVDRKWDTCAIMQVYHKQGCRVLEKETITSKIVSEQPSHMQMCGPFRSSYSRLTNGNARRGMNVLDRPVVIIASGAGGGILLDFHSYVVANDIVLEYPVAMYYTSRSIPLFQFVTDLICSVKVENLTVNAHITSLDGAYRYEKSQKEREMEIGRASFGEIISGAHPDSEVHFCGAPGLQQAIKKLCKKRKLSFKEGHSFHTL